MKSKLLLIACCWIWVLSAFSQSFPCDGSFYVVMKVNNESVLQNMWLDASNKVQTRTIALSEPNRQYTCLGLSIFDLHLYALDFDTKELLRIDANGIVTSLGIPEDLDTTLEYWAGDISPEGRQLVVIGKNKITGADVTFFRINLASSNYYAGRSSVISSYPTAITDIATDPVRGILYGYDKRNKQIVVIGTSTVSHHLHKPIPDWMESLFFDRKGNLYGYGSSGSEDEQSVLYAIDKIGGAATSLGLGKNGNLGDGCSCPYTMTFTRTISPSVLLPCSDFVIDYEIINHAGIGKTGVLFKDILPDEFTITEMVDHSFSFGRVESAEGTPELVISNLDILIGRNIIKIKGTLGATTETVFETQASLNQLPLGLNKTILSDNPLTDEKADPNVIKVAQPNSIELEDYVTFNCDRDTATLKIPFAATTYEWNDSSTDSILRTDETGVFWLKAISNCIIIEDSIQLLDFPEKLTLDLGTPIQTKQGALVNLNFTTNMQSVAQWNWSSTASFDLSCQNCPTPLLTASLDNTYALQLIDSSGCQLVDSVDVTVTPVRAIFAATAFSPNGDNVNDIFYLQGSERIAQVKQLLIFDRWGNLLFDHRGGTINDVTQGWNGRFNDKIADAGTYVWIATIEFLDGKTAQFSGEVILVNH